MGRLWKLGGEGMKRFISAVLSLVMAFGLMAYLPIRAYAVDITNYVLTYPVTRKHNYLTRGYMPAHDDTPAHLALDINPKPDSASQSTNIEVMAAGDGKVIAVFTGCNNWNGYGKPCEVFATQTMVIVAQLILILVKKTKKEKIYIKNHIIVCVIILLEMVL